MATKKSRGESAPPPVPAPAPDPMAPADPPPPAPEPPPPPPAATSISDLLPGWSFRVHDGGWIGCTRPDGTQVNLQPSDKVHSETLRLLLVDLYALQEAGK